MKTRFVLPLLLMTSLSTLNATADDEVAGALLGAGAGAVIGHILGGNDAALFGGVLGAMVGAAAADDHDDHRHGIRPPSRPAPLPPPPAWREPPRARPLPPPVVVQPYRPIRHPGVTPNWRFEERWDRRHDHRWDWRHDDRWDRRDSPRNDRDRHESRGRW